MQASDVHYAKLASFSTEGRSFNWRIKSPSVDLVHPSQVETANLIFSPSPEAVEDAHRIIAVFSDPQHAASNVVNLDGRMVERLHNEQSQRLIAIHACASRD